MSDTKLQNFLLSPIECSPEGLYFKGTDYIINKNNSIIISKGSYLDFTTYFNLFSWTKWSEYTGITTLSLDIKILGHCSVRIKSINSDGEIADFLDIDVQSDDNTIIEIPTRILKGNIGISIRANESVTLISATWLSDSIKHNQAVKLAGVFCTFNRDEYLFNNLDIIKENLPDNFEIIVIDNGSRINKEKIDPYGEKFSLYHNPNTGGSGGFTRGIIEAISSKSDFTHVLLMDDDIHIEPGVLQRTIDIFKYIKPELRKHFVSGSMLLLDNPHKMFESTAQWNGFRIKNFKKNLNLLETRDLIKVNDDMKRNNMYAAWWYCAFPLSCSIKSNLPFPFFIYGDDIEFSLSHAEGFLTLNGIGVWHEPFHNKFSPLFKNYFFCRNTFIINALHPKRFSMFHTLINAAAHFYTQLLVHDYRSSSLVLEAMKDFIKGPSHVLNILETDLLKRSCIKGNFKELDEENKPLLIIPANFKRFKSVTYFLYKKLGVRLGNNEEVEIRTRSWRKIFPLFFEKIRLSLYILIHYRKVAATYRELERNNIFWKNRYDSIKEKTTRVS